MSVRQLGLKRVLPYRIARFFPELLATLERNVRFCEFVETVSNGLSEFSDSYGERSEIYKFISDKIIEGQPIDYLEFGVFKGESITAWASLNQDPSSRFFGFDSFTGLPEGWGDRPQGTFGVQGRLPETDDPRITFVPGIFQETLDGFLAQFTSKSRLVIHLDADLYSATLYVLAKIDPYLTSSSIIIFDEFSDVNHEFSAYYDYCRSFGRRFDVLCKTRRFRRVAVTPTP